MKLEELKQWLRGSEESDLWIRLPSNEFVPSHFHITEVGLVQKQFMDCGGVMHLSAVCVLQVWMAMDKNHRLKAGKLLEIIEKADKKLQMSNLEVEIEYEEQTVSKYGIYEVLPINGTPSVLTLLLSTKITDCLAPDKCGVTECCGGSCC